MKIFLLTIFFVFTPLLCLAQDLMTIDNFDKIIKKDDKQVRKAESLLAKIDPQIKSTDNKLKLKLEEYNVQSLEHRRRVFEWQYTSSIIIFYLVILIVLAGLIFSGIQFYISLKHIQEEERDKRRIHSKVEEETIDAATTKLEIGTHGIKVNSSVLGVIILVISLGFFYLYLAYIYPISEIGSTTGEMKQGVEQLKQ